MYESIGGLNNTLSDLSIHGVHVKPILNTVLYYYEQKLCLRNVSACNLFFCCTK